MVSHHPGVESNTFLLLVTCGVEPPWSKPHTLRLTLYRHIQLSLVIWLVLAENIFVRIKDGVSERPPCLDTSTTIKQNC